jgi:NADH-quinone oxidoreductase subunit G
MAGRASFPPGDAREDWAILRALSDLLGHKLPYDSLNALRQALFTAHPHLQRLDQIAPGSRADIGGLAAQAGKTDRAAFTAVIDDFYLTNPIARASAIMAECSVIAEGHGALTAAE